ncbi:MAG: GNAT family N-acetyltransferase [Burkholderiales bacterium]
MTVIHELSDNHIHRLHQLYQNEWWTKGRSLEETRRCISGSQICIGIIDEDQQLLAFARVITDYVFKALIFDVIVDKGARTAGLGRKLIESIRTHEQLKGVKHFEMYCLPELVPFYSKYGFTEDVGGVRFMRMTIA